MNIKKYFREVLNELSENEKRINEKDWNIFIKEILKSRHVFITGKGRSGLIASAFANRLLHLGISVSVVGEITNPHTQKGDLLIVVSGSGNTTSLLELVKTAKENEVKTVLITSNNSPKIGELVDQILILSGTSSKSEKTSNSLSIQPMGTSFEQLVFLIFDSLILSIMDFKHMTSDMMFLNHANLE